MTVTLTDPTKGDALMAETKTATMCGACGTGHRESRAITFTMTRGDVVLVFRGVPADVCDACGEELLDVATVQALERLEREALDAGVTMQVRRFPAA